MEIHEELYQILENLEESIIIMQDFKGEFVNQRFLESFSAQIAEFVPENSCSEFVVEQKESNL